MFHGRLSSESFDSYSFPFIFVGQKFLFIDSSFIPTSPVRLNLKKVMLLDLNNDMIEYLSKLKYLKLL